MMATGPMRLCGCARSRKPVWTPLRRFHTDPSSSSTSRSWWSSQPASNVKTSASRVVALVVRPASGRYWTARYVEPTTCVLRGLHTARDRPASPVLIAIAAPVQFPQHGRPQHLQGQPTRLDQQLDRMGTVLGQADLAPQPSLLGIRLGLDRVLGVPEQSQQQVLRADLLVTRDRLMGGDREDSCADIRRAAPPRP